MGRRLRESVLNRDGTLVIRPDSGDPATVVCQVLKILGERFPTTTNAKGFKILDKHVRLIQGDGVDFASLGQILQAIQMQGWSADNIAFGSGGGLLQKLNRDTLKFAFKCSAIVVEGQEREVSKHPITDAGKRSKSGRFKLVRTGAAHGSTFVTVRESDAGDDHLQWVFEDGSLLNRTDLVAVRKRAAIEMS